MLQVVVIVGVDVFVVDKICMCVTSLENSMISMNFSLLRCKQLKKKIEEKKIQMHLFL